ARRHFDPRFTSRALRPHLARPRLALQERVGDHDLVLELHFTTTFPAAIPLPRPENTHSRSRLSRGAARRREPSLRLSPQAATTFRRGAERRLNAAGD